MTQPIATEGWVTPPDHIGFLAHKLFGAEGEIIDGAIARLAPGGGGPQTPHQHVHDHLFIVVSGQATVRIGATQQTVGAGESIRVPGKQLHAVWNEGAQETVMIGISVRQRESAL